MTRVDLQLLIIDAIKDVNRYDFGTQSILLTRALWPVLARVWKEGWEQGFDDGRGYTVVELEGDDRANPYEETSS